MNAIEEFQKQPFGEHKEFLVDDQHREQLLGINISFETKSMLSRDKLGAETFEHHCSHVPHGPPVNMIKINCTSGLYFSDAEEDGGSPLNLRH